eukprot:TRINITY_DN377_c0_g1_i3.p1 TRINITY_DN377_c0_g1~~TRINITY_DN377_c0_g1_i3.p1  ORF type:complete len:235 (+),score=134.56 TRINITY_DN377_c0_g1_i3:69-707(+)
MFGSGARSFGRFASRAGKRAFSAAATGVVSNRAALFGAATLAAGIAFAAAKPVLAEGHAVAVPNAERTFIALKPDAVQRGLVADIIKRFETRGFKLVAIKVIVPSEELAGNHYDEHRARPFFGSLVSFLTSGPVVAMVWEGKEVVKTGRMMIGVTNPLASAPGTIRGDYAIDVGRNIIHGSDSLASAEREIALWFKPEEIANWTPATKGLDL